MTLIEFFKQIYPLLENKTMQKVEQDCVEGKVTAYWVGNIIRIDIKPH